MGESSAAADPDRLLAIYLRDHCAAAEAGLALAARSRHANEGTPLGEVLAGIEAEITADRHALAVIMDQLSVSASGFKKFAARAAEVVGRVKSNGRIFRYSPLSRVLELEGLIGGIDAKRGLWVSLRCAVADRPELDSEVLDDLVARATSQHERLRNEHRRAAAAAFTGSR